MFVAIFSSGRVEDKSGRISFEEFVACMKEGPGGRLGLGGEGVAGSTSRRRRYWKIGEGRSHSCFFGGLVSQKTCGSTREWPKLLGMNRKVPKEAIGDGL